MVAFCADYSDGGANFFLFFFCNCFTWSDRGQVRRSNGKAEMSWLYEFLWSGVRSKSIDSPLWNNVVSFVRARLQLRIAITM